MIRWFVVLIVFPDILSWALIIYFLPYCFCCVFNVNISISFYLLIISLLPGALHIFSHIIFFSLRSINQQEFVILLV